MMKGEKSLLQQARDYFQRTGFCGHHPDFRTIVNVYGVRRETCKVCAKEFGRSYP